MTSRKAVLEDIADAELDRRAQLEAEQKALEASIAERVKARKEKEARRAELTAQREPVLRRIEDALDGLSSSVRELLGIDTELSTLGANVNTFGTVRELSRWVAAHLSHAVKNPAYFGQVVLRYTGAPRVGDSLPDEMMKNLKEGKPR